ncbi:3-oxoacyl-ACP synthase [Lysinibacillus contaminans]|uniref:3-oxoacyl-ACP synthase n=1 Tax=Lysinibacillus contaminans TaxID=1293441 RepID=A0ABR5K111_9BACI|nr:glucose 1-dehydrogenase [Lysinibacillus contaminans]KOS68531.1 3-oxoacyl-ACP synthase [Lysinibacillus contaminans]
MRLKNKVAIITGGASGIGYAAVKRFIDEGAKVVIVDIDTTKGQGLAAFHEMRGDEVSFVAVDVSNRENVDLMVARVIELYGTIDILINNAGITQDGMFLKMSEEAFQRVMDVNVKGVFNCTQAVLPHMLEKGRGKIVNTASVSGVYGNVGQTNYAASKAAIIGITKTWAKEFGRKGINVNAVAPGFTHTDMVEKIPDEIVERMLDVISLARMAEPEDIANAYLYLASDEASYVHGHILNVDGGIMM